MQSLPALFADLESWRDRAAMHARRWEPVPPELVLELAVVLAEAARHPRLGELAEQAAMELDSSTTLMLASGEGLDRSLDGLRERIVDEIFGAPEAAPLVGRRAEDRVRTLRVAR